MAGFIRLNFLTQLKIEFLLPFTGCRKVLGKMPGSVERSISTTFLFSPPLFPLLDIPFSLETYNPSFYDDALESGRMKTINIKPWIAH